MIIPWVTKSVNFEYYNRINIATVGPIALNEVMLKRV